MSELVVREVESTEIESIEWRNTVSHSEVESALRCERAHFYGYGMGIRRKQESASLNRGTLGHAVLEAYFTTLKDTEDIALAEAAAIAVLASHVAAHPFDGVIASEVAETLAFFFEANPFRGWEILAVEKALVLEITDTLHLPIVVDLVARDLYGDVWVIDHKFMYDFMSDRDVELQSQLPKYVGALRALGYNIDRAGYNICRYRSLKVNTVETRHLFLPVELSVPRIQRTFTEQAIRATQLQQRKMLPLAEQSYLAVRTMNKMVCNNCGFRSLCVAELNNYQPELVLDSEYEKRERREFKTSE